MNTEIQYMTEAEAKALIKATYMKKLKIARKSMMCENQSNPKKIEINLQHSGEDSVQAKQANNMSSVVVRKQKLVIKKKVPEVPEEVRELVAELIDLAMIEVQEQELKRERRRIITEKANATRKANKARKEMLDFIGITQELIEDLQYEEKVLLADVKVEVSDRRRPIQKDKEGRVLEDAIETCLESSSDNIAICVERSLKVLKASVDESKFANIEDEEEKQEKIEIAKYNLKLKKKEHKQKLHHAIAEEYDTTVIVARRSEEGRAEKKSPLSNPTRLKEKTIRKLFFENCKRVLPHYIADCYTHKEQQQKYNDLVLVAYNHDNKQSLADIAIATRKLKELFATASRNLVHRDTASEKLYIPERDLKEEQIVLATHLSCQGVYVVRHTKNEGVVLRNSRDEIIGIGEPNEVMSEKDLLFHRENGLKYIMNEKW